MYQLLLKDGSKIGNYNIKASPAQTALKMAKQLYIDSNMSGSQTFQFTFVRNRTIAEGGDKMYKFSASVKPLPKTEKNLVRVGNYEFYRKFDVKVKNLLRD